MKKQDLKSGMIIETRAGKRALIVLNNVYGKDAVIFSEKNWTGLDSYNNDLLWMFMSLNVDERSAFSKTVDIMKIYEPNLPTGFLSINDNNGLKLLWERKEEKFIPEYTMEELVSKLGFEFKIKK